MYRQCSSADSTIAATSSSGKRALTSGSTLPQLTPIRIARSWSRATSTRKRTFSRTGFVRSWCQRWPGL